MTTLPAPIETYFRATNTHDSSLLAQCFTPDAVVEDQGEELTLDGLEKIREWQDRLHQQYRLSSKIIETGHKDGKEYIQAEISGDFDGSPLPFHYHFTLRNNKIARLEIHP